MDVYKKVETPTPPPVTVHLELTEDEYQVLREGAYQFHWNILKSSPSVHLPKVKGNESVDDIAKRLYNNLPVDLDTMRDGS